MPPTDSAKRDSAIKRGLAFIYQTACQPEHFKIHGADYLSCFYCISATSSDPELRRVARAMGRERAQYWRRHCARIPPKASADDITDLVFGSDSATRLGIPDNSFKQQLRKRSALFEARDFLLFDPTLEPPPADLPIECDCGTSNVRGRKTCRRCRRRLQMSSAYWVWLLALTRSYTGQRFGVKLGASFFEVAKWTPAMRPYPRADKNVEESEDFFWALYAVTHLVYALNDYSTHQLAPAWLPDEYEFLKRNLTGAIRLKDPDMMGEFLDALKSFGLTEEDALIKKGMNYLLRSQNEDGSWGDPETDDIYLRFHPTWTAIDGLRDYVWRGQRLSLQRLKPLLERCAKNRSSLMSAI